MSYNNFDYHEALDSIKANLFDIYEHQERLIGALEDEKSRQNQIQNYIKMKDTAITLIEEISTLYAPPSLKQEENLKKEDKENNISLPQPQVVEVTPKVEVVDTNHTIEVTPEEKDVNSNSEDMVPSNSNDTNLERFYLDDRNGTKPNFAYVSPQLLEVIKKNGTTDLVTSTEDELDNIDSDNHLYKIDENKAKGIIVRTDQYMKLALSRHRQEGVLQEAKLYRKKQAENSRKQMLKTEEEKMEGKVKTLKVA